MYTEMYMNKNIDPTLYGDGQIRYIYKDKDSNVYRPPFADAAC